MRRRWRGSNLLSRVRCLVVVSAWFKLLDWRAGGIPLFAPVMAMILPSSCTVLTGPDSGTAFILAAEEAMLLIVEITTDMDQVQKSIMCCFEFYRHAQDETEKKSIGKSNLLQLLDVIFILPRKPTPHIFPMVLYPILEHLYPLRVVTSFTVLAA